jgi:20S proteasome subunit beta 1
MEHNNSYQPSTSPPHTGTTIVACTFPGGAVLGADSRVSTGQYISNRASNKITSLVDQRVYLLRSGSAADTQAVSDYVRYFADQHESELAKPPPVRAIANLVKTINYENKQLVGAMIVAGWDEDLGAQVYGCPIGGTVVREKWTTDGSGSTFIWGHLDAEYRDDMTAEETEAFVAGTLALAMSRDGSSGGVIRLVTVTKHGAKEKLITPEEHPLMWDEIPEPAPYGMVI